MKKTIDDNIRIDDYTFFIKRLVSGYDCGTQIASKSVSLNQKKKKLSAFQSDLVFIE